MRTSKGLESDHWLVHSPKTIMCSSVPAILGRWSLGAFAEDDHVCSSVPMRDAGEIQRRCGRDAGEMQGRRRGDAGRGDAGETQGGMHAPSCGVKRSCCSASLEGGRRIPAAGEGRPPLPPIAAAASSAAASSASSVASAISRKR